MPRDRRELIMPPSRSRSLQSRPLAAVLASAVGWAERLGRTGGTLDLQDYLRVARQRWLLIAATVLAAVAAASLLTLQSTPMYQSTARLFVSTEQSDTNDAYTGGLFSQLRVTSYASLLSGEAIARRVVDRLDLDVSPESLSGQISAVSEPDTVIMSISVTDESPKRAQKLAQAVSEEFVLYVAELETPPGESTPPVKASIIDRATMPAGYVSPQPLRNLGLAGLLGVLVGVGLAFLRDLTDNRIRSAESLRTVSGDAPVLGNIHFDKGAIKTPLISDLPGNAPRVESFRVLRTNLQFVNAGAESKVFVITSAQPNEGKSTTACNLALSIADAGLRVVVVEGDLRRPKATLYFGLENSVGVTTVLIGRVKIEDALQHVREGCDLLASGSTPPNPAELLQSGNMRRLIEEMRRQYDVVLIDAPPLLPVTDAALLATQADGALLVVHHGVTTNDQVEACVNRLESVGARLLGTVVNMSPKPQKRGRGGYGYGYGYGYEAKPGRLKSEPPQKRGRRRTPDAAAVASRAPQNRVPPHRGGPGDSSPTDGKTSPMRRR